MGVGMMSSPYLLGKGIANTVGTAIADVATSVLDETLNSFRSYTGSRIKAGTLARFSTGGEMFNGSVAITGDAAGSNIFAHGAKPEIVRSNGDMEILPLNKTGTEKQQKMNRMSREERLSALATAISSHVVKYKYKLPEDAEDVSNEGEAIKVFSVKPGFTDPITVQGAETTVADLLANIYTQLALIASASGTNSELLTTIAANTVPQSSGSNSGGNPFAGGFPTNMDVILGGN
jgi:hypothetical protein